MATSKNKTKSTPSTQASKAGKKAAPAVAAKAPSKGKPQDAAKKPVKRAGSAVTASKVASKAASKPVAKPTPPPAKAASKPAPAAKTPAKPPVKTAAKGAAKPEIKPEGKPDSKAASKVAAKGVAKPAAKQPPAKSAPAEKSGGVKKAGEAKAPAKGGEKSKGAGKPEAAAKPAPSKPSTKKGPIDFATAKSVAAAAVVATPDAQGYVIINGRRVRVLSAAAVPAKRKVAAAPVAEEKPEPQIATIKTKLSAKDLEDYKQRLLQKRRQVFGMITGMEDEALRSSGGNLSNMPLHMADIGTDTYDQDFTLGMAESERGLLNEIDDALRRIEDRTYGVCQMSGQPIPKTRLDAKPWAKYTIESARRIESGQAR